MAQTVLITLTTAGADTGPFDLYSDADGYVTPFETGIAKVALTSGYTSSLVPDLATIIRVQSDSLCTNYVDLSIVTTTTTTTTAAPRYPFSGSGYSNVDENAACSDAILNNRTLVSDCAVIAPGCVIFTNPLGTNPLLGNSFVLIGGQGNFDLDPLTGVVLGASAIQC
jgi:hypothetical protein